ncbi:MAG: leucine-rich repeat protein [Lachnospiraceae bacterium]|nr:leucine-rich repeat protein [Lachnospiraceae bacterium]
MIQTRNKKIFSWVLILAMVISVIAPGSASVVNAEETYDGYVYVTIERFTLGQGLAAEPKKIGYHESDSMADILKRGYGEDAIVVTTSSWGSTFAGFVDGGEPEGWTVNQIPEKIRTGLSIEADSGYGYSYPAVTVEDIEKNGRTKADTLSNGDYTGQSSLMSCIDNTADQKGIFALTYGEEADGSHFHNGSVYRIEFGIYHYSDDLNITWSQPMIDFPDKDDLIRDIVDYSGDKAQAVYKNAVATLEDWDATAEEVDKAENALEAAAKYETIYKDSLKNLKDGLENPGYKDEWAVLSITRAGLADDQWKSSYIDNVAENVKKIGSNVLDTTGWSYATENARVVIGLTAAGGNPTDVAGYNLLEPLADYKKVSGQGINGIIFALIALDTKNYDIPELNSTDGEQTTRAKLINGIVNAELKDGGWTYFGDDADVDLTGMAIQALAPYYKGNEQVKTAVDRGLEYLSKAQDNSGAFNNYAAKLTSDSTAQVVCALSALGQDADSDEAFVKGNNSALEALLSFYDADAKSFKAGSSDDEINAYSTLQVLYALTAYDMMNNGKGRLYMSKDHEHGKIELNGAKESTCTVVGYTGDKVCVECGAVVEKGNNIDKKPHTSVEIPAVAATETKAGKTAGKKCSVCGEILEAPKDVPATGKKETTDVPKTDKEVLPSEYKATSTASSNPTVEYAGATDNNKAVVTIQNTVKDSNSVSYKVTKVADNAFAGNKIITDVTMGENITEIGANAFKNCTKLSGIIIQSDSIAKIDESAFAGAKALKEVDFSECKLQTIDKNAFSGCKKLKSIKINGNKLTKVGKNAFKNIKKNAKIIIYAKNKKAYKKVVKLIKKSGAKKVKYSYKKKK